MNQYFCAALLCAVAGAAVAAPEPALIPVEPLEPAPQLKVAGFDVNYGGFVKLDALYSVFSDGDVASTDQGRDYFRPSSIPVAATTAAENAYSFLDFHAKDTRFFFKMSSRVEGHTLAGTIELDFRSLPGGASETVTNAYNPRLRRAFLTYDNWLMGQEWSLLRNLDAHPDQIDDLRGPVEALVIVRQPTIRYTLGGLQLAIENAETNLLPRTGTVAGATPVTATFVTGDAKAPDLTARYNLKTSFGSFSAAAVARQLSADGAATGGDAPNNQADGTAFAWALNLSGKVDTFGKDDVRFGVTAGDGVGRYLGLATIADAVVDADNGLEPIAAAAGYVAYRHVWSARWRSTATVAALEADNPAELTGPRATRGVQSAHVNLLFSPADKLTFGLEGMHAVREVEDGEDGSLSRLQFAAKYEY
ncbi:MAG TPA: DcaP family trimeric outer membrane transporter [Verrucomicrobiae bacterium]|nr:DcaP family trimeric outer membrane transporter [Verrucomicrobiae bacterium]